jgi:hypothetical protein
MQHSGGAGVTVQSPSTGSHELLNGKHESSSLAGTARTAATGVTGPCVFAVSRGCFIAAPIATPGAVTGVDDRINTHFPASRRQPRRPAIGWTPLVLWIAQKRSRRP